MSIHYGNSTHTACGNTGPALFYTNPTVRRAAVENETITCHDCRILVRGSGPIAPALFNSREAFEASV